MTTAKYVVLSEPHLNPAGDIGHHLLGKQDVDTTLLDAISSSSLLLFVMGAMLLRELRLWTKLFFSNAILFILKGTWDWMTVLPDSIGYHECERRLNGDPAKGPVVPVMAYMKRLGMLEGREYVSALLELELHGVDGKWPVRYCSDMLLSGHTFAVLLYSLAVADLVRRATVLLPEGSFYRHVFRYLIGFWVALSTIADMYYIVLKHFHYTVDVVMSVVITFLLYTNAGMAILTQWFVSGERPDRTEELDDAGEIWIPRAMIPCCCFNGYYTIKWLEDKEVKLRQDRNKSALWERLTKFSESLVPEQQSTNAEEQRGPNFGTFSDAKDEESRG